MKNPDEGTPGPSLSDEIRPGADEAERLPSRLERYAKARKRSIQMCAHLKGIDDALWVKVDLCGSWLHFKHYYTVGKVRLADACFCRKHLICPLCAIRRGAKQLKSYLDRYRVILAENGPLRASMITLTVKNGPDLLERFGHLVKGVQALRMRGKDHKRGRASASEWSKVLGAVGTYEFTNKGQGWHPHCHIAVLHRQPIDQQALSAEWKKITCDSWICDVSPFLHPDEPERDFVEVFKYAMKFQDLTLEDNYQAFLTLSGRRLIFSQGLFYGVKVPESLADEQLDDLPFIDLFYEYVQGAGYSLADKKKESEVA